MSIRTDEHLANSLIPGWSINDAVPEAYSAYLTSPNSLQLIPIPTDAGDLDLITVQTPTALDVTTGVLMNIPEDFCWVIKFGALADLLGRDGQSTDPLRAEYSEMRYQQGVDLARISNTILVTQINGSTIQPTSIFDLDAFNPTWQNSSGTPTQVGSAGQNLIVLIDIPDAGPYSVTMDVIRNAPMPSLDADNIQLGREELDVVLDYAQHLASFKMGGAEFQTTIPLFERMVRLASIHNEKLKANATMRAFLEGQSNREQKQRPMREMATV